jgi:hypothetical protein
MKSDKSLLLTFLLLIVIASLYRVIPNRAPGFAPQLAMAIFGGAIIKNKKWAFALPLLSMFLSDVMYQLFYNLGWTNIPGFYEGQITNYILFALLTLIGFSIRKLNVLNIGLASIAAPTIYFLLSNFMVWLSPTAGLQRPRNLGGLVQTITDGLPFYRNSLIATLVFSTVLFGGYFLFRNYFTKSKLAA